MIVKDKSFHKRHYFFKRQDRKLPINKNQSVIFDISNKLFDFTKIKKPKTVF